MEALALHEDAVEDGQPAPQAHVLRGTHRKGLDAAVQPVLLEEGDVLQDAVAAGRHLPALDQDQNLLRQTLTHSPRCLS